MYGMDRVSRSLLPAAVKGHCRSVGPRVKLAIYGHGVPGEPWMAAL
jgi:hypothetical protein